MERALIRMQARKAEGRKRPAGGGPKPIRAVTFDVGGTLIECRPSVGHIYADVAARWGHKRLSPTALNRRFKSAWAGFGDFHHTRANWSALVDATFGGLLKELPSRTFFPELFERFSEPDAWHIFKDVPPALRALRSRGLKLGIVSNWDDRLRPLLGRLNLDSYFETILISCEVAAPKPAVGIFHSACAALGTEPGETLHVGDSREMDFAAARAAGLRALWLQRGRRRKGSGRIRSLRELYKI